MPDKINPKRLWRVFPLSVLAKCREWLRDLDQLRLRRMHKFH